ncbi:hypothetical protein BKP45_04140 [Anaerobacillus alkalidiazotrophicus]|uniref:Peptidase M23 n=1 Tax=Anaerobacillus alkalidiazotrophicus TaxID=472963 RepID=A0A1S2MAV2_9BACI|nr:M23 family metallopeptidase [Anaerobacillus alkalidiazotrophicus]OIJ21888.1 hypothetical protein BKP45_04140 [Anaerobacillus alkalidiazotrophicus]
MKHYKHWLDRLPKGLIGKTKTNLNLLKTFTNKYKKVIGAGLCTALLATNLHTGFVNAQEEVENNGLQSIYHIYIDGNRVGSVNDSSLVTKLKNDILQEFSGSYEDLTLVIGQEIDMIPELVFNARTNTDDTLEKLENRLSVKAESISLEVEGEEIAYVSSEDEYLEVIEKLMLQYVSKEELKDFQEAKENDELDRNPSVGEKIILDIKLSKDIESGEAVVNPEEILSVEDAVKQINLGTLEDDVYVVEPGDVLGTIAEESNLSMDEILALNPKVTQDTLLQIGDELNVTVYKPIVKVIIEEASKVKEDIPFQTETKDDANMSRGETKVQQEGQKGERVVSYSITRENGRTIERTIVSENVTKEPVNRVVLRGTKVTPSRGTGQLAWPAVGGYISSYQGMRWGRFHRGIDIARPSNYNILAADNGTVTFAGWDGGYGNKIIINHNNGMRTLYAHLASMDVKVGQTVARGQKIGVMGTTGNSTGIHLHFEVYQNGELKNPMDFLNR